MKITIRKRDGRELQFNVTKIQHAIGEAYKDTFETDVADDEKVLELTNKVVKAIKATKKLQMSVEEIQNIVEDTLIKAKEVAIAKKYIAYRANRTQIREAASTLMLDYKNITFTEAEESNTKRDNANVDGNTAMGTMLQYGSIGSRHFAVNHIFKKEYSVAHQNGDIHIHDLDFVPMGTTTCLTNDAQIKIKDANGNIKNIQIHEFDSLFKENNNLEPEWQDINNTFILGRNGWTKLIRVMRRKSSNTDKLYFLRTRTGLGIKLTENHKVPILRENNELLATVKEIQINDSLLSKPSLNNEIFSNEYIDIAKELNNSKVIIRDSIVITNISKLKQWLLYQYDIKSLQKEIKSTTSRNGEMSGYLTIDQFEELRKKYPMPYEVLMTLEIKLSNSKNSVPLLLPITNELAKLFGYIYSAGCISFHKKTSTYQMVFINKDERKLNHFKNCFEKVFMSHLSIRKEKSGIQNGCIICDMLICLLVGRVLGYKLNASDISIPDFIINGREEIKYSFISSAIDGNGCLSKDSIYYNTACEKFAQQIVICLKSLEIDSYYDKQNIKGTETGFKDCTRNYDSYRVIVSRANSVSKLANNLNAIKQSENLKQRALITKTIKYESNKIIDKIQLDNEEYYYDIETAEHWFIANGYVVHNCSQINLDKLFKDGFNTGHGFLREPQDIMSYAALAAIAIQSNQNDQHGIA